MKPTTVVIISAISGALLATQALKRIDWEQPAPAIPVECEPVIRCTVLVDVDQLPLRLDLEDPGNPDNPPSLECSVLPCPRASRSSTP